MKIEARVGDQGYAIDVTRESGRYIVEVNGERHHVDARKLEGDFYSMVVDGKSYEVSVEPNGGGYWVRHGAARQQVQLDDAGRRARELRGKAHGPETIAAMMPGKVVRLLVAEGDRVEQGQGVLVLEAMKMENEIGAPKAGTVTTIRVEPGSTVESGESLAVIE